MRLKSVSIQNYRTFENVTINFSDYGVMVGANNSGKTSVFSLLDKILNPFKSLYYSDFEVSDFRNLDESLVVDMVFDYLSEAHLSEFKFYLKRIELEESQPEEEGIQIHLRYMCKYDTSTESFSKKIFIMAEDEEIRLSEKQRKLFPFIYRGAQKDNRTELKMGRNTFLNRLVGTIDIDSKAKESIQKLIEKASDILSDELKEVSKLIEKNSKHVIDYPVNNEGEEEEEEEEEEEHNIRFNLLNLESDKLLSNLEIYIFEAFKSDFEALTKQGLGYQNAIVLAIFKSFATSAIKGNTILALEEPELFLPPHSQRALARDFKHLSVDNQILIATHSPSFMLNTNPRDIIILRKSFSGSTTVSQFNQDATPKELEWFSKRVNAINGEAFFSNVVCLVEGETEEGALNELSYKLDTENSSFSFDKYGVTVLNCGGKTKIKEFNRLVKYFSLPTVALIDFDADKNNSEFDRDEGEIDTLKGMVDELIQFPREPEWGDFEGVLTKKAPIINLLRILDDLEIKKLFCGQLVKLNKVLSFGEDTSFIRQVSSQENINIYDLVEVKEHIKGIDPSYVMTWFRAAIKETLKKEKSAITGKVVASNLSGADIPDDFARVIRTCIYISKNRLKQEQENINE
ncbi:ATP-dependent nuclease [Lentibacillus jeotgali]|uniref:ATP-dependent nuclease n=1 Tax=Lentibacillus jeotgali TaxID=558169 RepID=UPI00026287AD|nr:AAA family ATPase [Lentibacillus jeotgali]